jgi:hypothetical protein
MLPLNRNIKQSRTDRDSIRFRLSRLDYDLTIEATGFKTQKETYLMVDADAALKLDAVLTVGQHSENITVAEAASVEARSMMRESRASGSGEGA